MRTRRVILIALSGILALGVLASGYRSYTMIRSEAAGLTPGRVVTRFYEWYLRCFGDPGSGKTDNPLVDGAYRTNRYLSQEFIHRVDETVGSFSQGGYDPFLCAQDVPESFTVDPPIVQGNEASVVVRTSFPENTFAVHLVRVDAHWRIADVSCGGSDTPPSPAPVAELSPEEVVQGFYDRHVEYIGDPGTG